MILIIDFHTHAFPDALAARAIATLENLGSIDAFTDGSVSDLKRSMMEANITHGVLCNIVVKPGQTEKVHEFAKSLQHDRAEHGLPCVIPLASVHPKEPNWKEWIQIIKEDGFKGIKLHPGYQQFYINDPDMEAFYREVFRQGLFLIFHAGWDAGYPNPMHAAPDLIADILPVLEQGTTILAHMGGNMRPQAVLDLLCGKNIYFDTSYSMEKIPLADAKKIIRKHTPDRMLFGSDAPWASQKTYTDYYFNQIVPGFLSEKESSKITWDNGAALLGLK